LINDSEFACPALQMDTWTAKRVPTFAYEFNDDAAPGRFVPAIGIATHTSELGYLFDLPDALIQDPLTADQQRLADSMQRAWARFAANGNPASIPVPCRRSSTARTCSRLCRLSRSQRRPSVESPLRLLGRRLAAPAASGDPRHL
jgi:carboxylesterase type B